MKEGREHTQARDRARQSSLDISVEELRLLVLLFLCMSASVSN